MKDPLKSLASLKWPEDKDTAKEVQLSLSKAVKLKPLRKPPALVAGVDSAFFGDRIVSAVCLFKYPELTLIEENHAVREVTFPYIPGLLSFREGPAVIEAIKGLKNRPDVILFDGQGIAHPRGLGIASYVGVLLGIPSIGCAKSRLIGSYIEPGKRKGSFTCLEHGGNVIGAVLRTQTSVKPLFISPGNLIDLAGSIEVTLGSTGRYRLPEPTRCADMLSGRLKKRFTAEKIG